jgi:hypothetical protein
VRYCRFHQSLRLRRREAFETEMAFGQLHIRTTRLFFDRLRDLRMQTARRVDSDPRGEIEEEIAINIADPAAAALLGDNRIEPRHGLAHEFSIERQNLSRLGAWKRRGNSWLMHRAILQISPREKIAPDRRLRQSLKRFPDHHNTRLDAAADVGDRKTLCAVDLARARLPVSCVNASSNLPHTGRTDGMAVANQTAASVDGQMAGRERRCAAFNQLRALASLGDLSS